MWPAIKHVRTHDINILTQEMTLFILFWTRKVFFTSQQIKQDNLAQVWWWRGLRQGRIWWRCHQILASCSGRPWKHYSGKCVKPVFVNQKCLRKTWWKDTVKLGKKKTTLAHKVLEFGELFYPFTKLQFIPTSCYLLQYVVYVSYDKGDHNTPLPLKHTAIERLKMTVSSHGMGAHTFNLTIWETEADNLCEFNVTLDYKRLNKSKRETEPTDGCAHL